MKRLIIVASVLIISGCSKEQLDENLQMSALTGKVFSADTELPDSKTALNAEENSILWQQNDRIMISDGENLKEYETSGSGSTATFNPVSGDVASGCPYHAIFPSSIVSSITSAEHKFYVTLPGEQYYDPTSLIDNKAMPMVSYIASGNNFQFRNAGGIIKINLKTDNPNVKVKSITLTADEYLSGKATITWSSSDPVVEWVADEAYKSIKLVCDTPVTISNATTPFYFVVPAGTYTSLKVIVETDFFDISQTLASKTDIAVGRSKLTTFNVSADKIQKNLSLPYTSNCYLVTKLSGKYIFDVSHKGNSSETSDAISGGKSVKVLWESLNRGTPAVGSVISNCLYDSSNKTVTFVSAGNKGNALIALYDDVNGTGNILWSWHIWVCDDIVDQTYTKSEVSTTLMDRNLGALSANPEDKNLTSGMTYQFGRKDPFPGSDMVSAQGEFYTTNPFTKAARTSETGTIAYTVAHPNTFITTDTLNDRWEYSGDNDYWDDPNGAKTIYDPCPAGYKTISAIIKNDINYTFWNYYRFHETDAENKYHYFPADKTNYGRTYSAFGVSSWYPAAGYRASTHSMIIQGTAYCVYMSAKDHHGFMVQVDNDSGINVAYQIGRACASSIRCQKM